MISLSKAPFRSADVYYPGGHRTRVEARDYGFRFVRTVAYRGSEPYTLVTYSDEPFEFGYMVARAAGSSGTVEWH